MELVRRIIGFSIVFGLALLGMPPLAAVAGANVACGAEITRSSTLAADVGPCSGNGLVVTADKVTLNLGGHRVFGTVDQGRSAGIVLTGTKGVTVKNGSVDNFDAGVLLFRGGSNTIEHLDVHDNIASQYVADSGNAGLFGDGILIVGSSANDIVHNVVHDNGPFAGITVGSDTAFGTVSEPLPTRNVISHNLVTHNAVSDVCPTWGRYLGAVCRPGDPVFNRDIGIRIEGPGATFTTVSDDRVTQSGSHGVAVLNYNRFVPLDHYSPPNTDTLITDSTISANGVADAEVGQHGGDGISLPCFTGPQPCATRTTIRANRVTTNPGNGIALGRMATGNMIIANLALGNGFGSVPNGGPQYTDGSDLNVDPPCASNTWLANILATVNQPCVHHHTGMVAAVTPAVAVADPAPLRRDP